MKRLERDSWGSHDRDLGRRDRKRRVEREDFVTEARVGAAAEAPDSERLDEDDDLEEGRDRVDDRQRGRQRRDQQQTDDDDDEHEREDHPRQ
ncbi:MAG: hypothetical protein AUH85_11740 [Chloroflexi bacterium 13_1_40CM_4_68_4]|nr:MAG: hypothetical protein AUH85_11740 [Chloroflexi bacterium 13_1_40CM_4_68_4]